MKKNIKSFVSGVLIGALLISLPVFAEQIYEKIEVVRNSIVVNVDGVKLDADNFVYEGTTYVPIRKVAETFGRGVNYDEETNSAYIVTDCSFKYEGDVIGTINGYEVTDTMYADYERHLSAINEYSSDAEKEVAVKNEIVNNVLTYQIANALGVYIDYNYVKNYENMLTFIHMQYGGEEEFKKEAEKQGYTENLFKHIREINHLKSHVLVSSDFNGLEIAEAEKILSQVVAEYKKESKITWK